MGDEVRVPDRLQAAKLVQAVNMAYDMYVGEDNVKVVAVSAGQVVMMSRLLPHLSAALTLQKTNREVSLKALKVVLAMVLSHNGCEELLAHPNSPGTIVPWLLSMTSMVDTTFTPLALDVLREICDCEEGVRQTIDSTKGTGDFAGPLLVKYFLKTISIGLHSVNSEEIIEVSADLLLKVTKAKKVWQYFHALEMPVFKSMAYALAFRLLHHSKVVTEPVMEVFLQMCEKEMLQIRLQDAACRYEVRAVLIGLAMLLFRGQSAAARSAAILWNWTFRPSGLGCLVESQLDFGQLLNGLIQVGSNFSQANYEQVVGHVAGTVDNLLGHSEFNVWLAERPSPLQATVNLMTQGMSCSNKDVAGAFTEVFSTFASIPATREALLRLSGDTIDLLLVAMTDAAETYKLAIRSAAISALFNLTESEKWITKIVEWLKDKRRLGDQSGLLLTTAMLQSTYCGEDGAMKKSVDILTSLIQYGGFDVFGSVEAITLLVDALQSCVGQTEHIWRLEDACTLLAVALSWDQWRTLVSRALMQRDPEKWENTVRGLAAIMIGKNSIAADAALGIVAYLVQADVTGFRTVKPQTLYRLFLSIRTGPCFEAQQAVLCGFKIFRRFIADEELVEVVSSWFDGLQTSHCENFTKTASQYLYLDDEVAETCLFMLDSLCYRVAPRLIVSKEVAEELITPILELAELDKFRLQTASIMVALSCTEAFHTIDEELYGKILLTQCQNLTLDGEGTQTVSIEGLTGSVENRKFRDQGYMWIQNFPSAHIHTLLQGLSTVMHGSPSVSKASGEVVTFLSDCKAGMENILVQEHATLEACVLGFVYMVGQDDAQAKRNGVQILKKMIQLGDLKAVVGKKLLRVVLTALVSLQNPNEERMAQAVGDFSADFLDKELIMHVGEIINTYASRCDLLAQDEELLLKAAHILTWTLDHSSDHVLKSTVENLVNLVTSDKFFEAPKAVIQILLEGLTALCTSSHPDYADIGHYTLFSVQYHEGFLTLPTTFIVPCVTITRELLFTEDKRKQKMAAEVINNLAASERLMEQEGELIHSLLSGLTITLGSDDDFVAEFSQATAMLIQDRRKHMDNTIDVPNEVLSNIAEQLKSSDPMIVGQAVESTNRLAKTFNVASANRDALEKVIYGLSNVVQKKGPASRAATKALGGIAMSADGDKVPPAVLAVSLQHLTIAITLGSPKEAALAAVSVANLTKCNDWVETLTTHFRNPQLDYAKLLANLSVLLEDKNRTTQQAAVTILEFMVLVAGVKDEAVEVMLTSLSAVLMNAKVPDVNCHTSALYVVKLYFEKEGAADMHTISLNASEDIIEALVPFADSPLFTQREYVQVSMRVVINTILGRGIVAKVLAGPCGNDAPGALAVILGIILDVHGPEHFMQLNPKMLVTTSHVLMEHLKTADDSDSTRDRDLTHKMLFRLLDSTPGAAFTLEVLINGGDPIVSQEAVDVLAKYIEEHGVGDILVDQNVFFKVLNMLGGAALKDAKRANMAFDLAAQIARYGSVNGYSLGCMESLMQSKAACHSGLSAYLAEKWLVVDEQVRQVNKLRAQTLEQFRCDVAEWAMDDNGDGMMTTSLIRLIGHLTVNHLVMKRCMPEWLKDNHPIVSGCAIKGVRVWLGKNSMQELVAKHFDCLQYAILSFARHAREDDFAERAVDFMEAMFSSELGRNTLLEQDDTVLPLILNRLAYWFKSSNMSVGQSTARMLHGRWKPFILKMTQWFEDGEVVQEETPQTLLGTVSSFFTKKADSEEVDFSTLHSGQKLTNPQARGLILEMSGAARKQLHSSDNLIASSSLEMLSILCSTNESWIMLFCSMPGFAQDLIKIGRFVESESDADIILASEIIVQLTASKDGRYQMARLLQEDNAVRLLRALEAQTTSDNPCVKVKANTAFYNLTMEGDSTWQLWLSQIDPVLGAMGKAEKDARFSNRDKGGV